MINIIGGDCGIALSVWVAVIVVAVCKTWFYEYTALPPYTAEELECIATCDYHIAN